MRDAIHDIDTRCDDDNIHVDSEKKNDTSTTTTTPPPPIRKVNLIRLDRGKKLTPLSCDTSYRSISS